MIRVAFKAVIVILCFTALAVTFALLCEKKQKEICCSTLERRVESELGRILQIFVQAQNRSRQKKNLEGRELLISAKEMMQTLQTLFRDSFLETLTTSEDFRRSNSSILQSMKEILLRKEKEEEEDGSTSTLSATDSTSKIPSWKDFLIILHYLYSKIQKEIQKQISDQRTQQQKMHQLIYLNMSGNLDSSQRQLKHYTPESLTYSRSERSENEDNHPGSSH